MIEEDRREGREEGRRRRRRSTCTARKREEEQERESTRWSRDEQRAVLERRMADRNEDFNWYPGLSLSLSLSLSLVRRLVLFVIVSFCLPFLYHSLLGPSSLPPLVPFSSKNDLPRPLPRRGCDRRGYLYTGERSRKLRQGVRVRARDRTQRAPSIRHEGEKGESANAERLMVV